MPKVIVGLSGGVDSSIAALLLKKQGYDVYAVFMNNWHEPITDAQTTYCTAAQDLKDVHAICQTLEIPLETIDFSDQYWDKVFEYFLSEYTAGRTPNPDILCNKEIKFKAFLDYALAQGADFIATGHYAIRQETSGTYQLKKGTDLNKDQSYFLYTLNQWQLAHSLFPVGELEKPKVREMAKSAGLITHSKKDSTGICFIGERKFQAFLSEYLLAKPGKIQTSEGEVIGEHQGLMFYTLGQRQGLKIGGKQGAEEKPWYVAGKAMKTNRLIVVQGHDHPLLFTQTLHCNHLHWVSGKPPGESFKASAKIRYRQTEQPCQVKRIDSDHYQVDFEVPQWAATPGQSIVFYQDDICLGGGVILEQIKQETA